MVELFLTFPIPDFVHDTEFVSLRAEGDYAFIGGRIVSSDGVDLPETEYRAATNETVTDHSTSKCCRLSRDSYAVGALARLNNNFSLLAPQAREVARLFGLAPVNHNPFMNNIAQLVECFHATHMAMRGIDRLLDATSGAPLTTPVIPGAGEGVGAVEVPRGVLFHHYEYDQTGRIVRANCVIPTTQNNAEIQASLTALTRQFAVAGMTDAELERLCSMLVRAYDPCISCAVH
jgi:sulfhydrogenase subunit alpha